MKTSITTLLFIMGFSASTNLYAGNLQAQLQQDGAFVAEADKTLQSKLLAKIGSSQCESQWVGLLQRQPMGVLVSQMRPAIDSKEEIINSDLSKSYYLPTTITGVWFEIRKFANRRNQPGRVELRKFAPNKLKPLKRRKKIYRWRASQNCKRYTVTKTETLFRKTGDMSHIFTDRDLRTKIKTGKGLIYLWSPNMPYSTGNVRIQGETWGLDALFKVAKAKGLKVEMLLDPSAQVAAGERTAVSLRNKHKALSEMKVKRGTTLELYMRMVGLHMPTLLYYENGQIARTHLPGISSEGQITKYIDQQAQALSGTKVLESFRRDQ